MGAWSPEIFGDDDAVDARGAFEDALASGMSVPEATTLVMREFAPALDDMDSGPAIVMALAALQLERSQLQPEIRAAAINAIDSGDAMSRWEDEPTWSEARQLVLQQFRQQLTQ